MNIRDALYAAAAIVATIAGPAGAAEPYWSSIATACTPDSLSIQNNRYQSPTDNYVTPQKTNIDPIVLICGVQPNPGASASPTMLSMTYLDNSGAAPSGHVLAELIRVSRTRGSRGIVTSVTSNGFPATTTAKNHSAAFAGALDFEANFYYVRIEIERKTIKQNVRSIGVALE
jgi:hypothetical protein